MPEEIKKAESITCKLCYSPYNILDKKPRCFMPCGHTYCEKCINELLERNCPKCKKPYNQAIVDFDCIDLVKKYQNSKSIPKQTHIYNQQLQPVVVHLINEGTREQQLIGLRALRKLLSKEQNPPIQEVINAGLVKTIVEFLDSTHSEIVYESTWTLTNITSGTSSQTQCVVKHGAIAKLTKHIKAANVDTSETAIWTLGNIAGDSTELRDLVIESGALELIVSVLIDEKRNHSIKYKKNGIWTLSNFCRNKDPLVDLIKIKKILPVFQVFIDHVDYEILSDVCWAISYLTDGPNERIEFIIKNFDLNKIANLLRHDSFEVLVPALRIIGNIVTGDDKQTQAILDCNILTSLSYLIKSVNNQIRKEVCWAISNITAGTCKQIQLVIDSNILPGILEIIKTEKANAVKKEAIWVFANALTCGSDLQKQYFHDLNTFPVICKLLNSNDPEIVQISLDSIISFLKCDSNFNMDIEIQLANEFETLKQIERLTMSPNKLVFVKAETIMKRLKKMEM